ncbi:MAG: hypothetical protein RL404_465 [Pseudomonadota bacterium]|jgi:prepilin-type N-terminal cleavage/methylation domain-containing protein
MDILRAHPQAGFSLLELVLVMVLTSVLAIMSIQPLIGAFRARAEVAGNVTAIDALRYATERLAREIRQARFDTAGSGFQVRPLDLISGVANASRSICFTRVGGAAGNSLTTLAAGLSGSSASLDTVASYPGCAAVSPQVLANRVTTLKFEYWTYGTSSVPQALSTTDPNFGKLLAFIDITMSVSTPDGTIVTYPTRVVLRNGAWGETK